MFFYITFLRPPPVQAGPYGNVSITPQISNDLRTESLDTPQDLYYAWALHAPLPRNLKKPLVTQAVKFTTLRPSSAYKPIDIPVPNGVREGQYWRLVITGHPPARAATAETIALGAPDVGRVPFPVMSMPIAFIGRGSKGAAKQEMIERTFLVPCRADEAEEAEKGNKVLAPLSFRESTAFDLDKKIWDSGIGLSAWLVHLFENPGVTGANPAKERLYETLFSEAPRTILDLGAGIGMASIALSVIRSRPIAPEEPKDRIIATDVESALPLLERNIAANSAYYQSATPEALVLDWDDDEFPEEIKNLDGFDVILMADVAYNVASFPALTRTLAKLARLGSKSPAILLGYKERDPSERTFWPMMAELGFKFDKIGERAGAGGAPVEIWLGRAGEQ